jgi:predicted amidohydrolase YtcJ
VILANGRIYTMNPVMPRVSGLAITRDGRVARGVEAWEGDASQVSNERLDLGGRTVLPGLIDAHVHFRTWAVEQARLDVSPCTTARACGELAATCPGDWVIGQGWHEARLAAAGAPTAALLEDVAPGRRIALWAHDRHTVWLSAAALAALGIGRDTAPVPGGVIERDATGEPTGLLREQAAWTLPLPTATDAEALAAVDAGQRAAHALGVTGIHDLERAGGFGLWQRLHADRRQTLRVHAAQHADAIDAVLATGLRTGFGDDLLRIGPVKAFLDGTLGSRTARVLHPLATGETGVELLAPAAFADLVRRASAGGLAIAVHAIGDRAVRDALDALAATAADWQPAGLRPRIEHAQLVHPDDIDRFGALGVTASLQPTHATTDRDLADAEWDASGSVLYPWRSLADAGAVLAFGSDAPIEALAPLAGIHAAVNRSADGRPPWRPAEALDVATAVSGFTTGAARAVGAERRVGRLDPGLVADLVVLDADPFTCPPEQIGAIGVVATMVGGRWMHGRPPWD